MLVHQNVSFTTLSADSGRRTGRPFCDTRQKTGEGKNKTQQPTMVGRNRGTLTFKGLNYMSHTHIHTQSWAWLPIQRIHTAQWHKQTHTPKEMHIHVCIVGIFLNTHIQAHTLGASLLLHTVGPSVRPDKVASESQFWFERGDLMTSPTLHSPSHFPSATLPLSLFSVIHSEHYSQFVSLLQSIYLVTAISLFPSLSISFTFTSTYLFSLFFSPYQQNQFSGGHCRADL